MASITLITDFGLEDPYVGMMKGVILARAPGTAIVDLTHAIAAHRPEVAGFWLARSLPWFAADTVHVAVVDPGVGSERRILAWRGAGATVLAPDNGLLEPLLRTGGVLRALALEALAAHLPSSRSRSFHGRDVFAPLAAALAAGRLEFEQLGGEIDDPVRGTLPQPVPSPGGGVRGCVLVVDHFGNLITNIEGDRLPRDGGSVRLGDLAVPRAACYSDVAPGTPLALINAHGLLEIALRDGRASERLGAGPGTPVEVGPKQPPGPR